jgi:hypothetical protein
MVMVICDGDIGLVMFYDGDNGMVVVVICDGDGGVMVVVVVVSCDGDGGVVVVLANGIMWTRGVPAITNGR